MFSRRKLRRMTSSGMLRRAALVRTDVSEERSASFIRTTRTGKLGRSLLRNIRSVRRLLVTASVVHSSPILSPCWKKLYGSPKRPFLKEPHGVTSQKTPLFTSSYIIYIISFPLPLVNIWSFVCWAAFVIRCGTSLPNFVCWADLYVS
jgi:hypothetical protein